MVKACQWILVEVMGILMGVVMGAGQQKVCTAIIENFSTHNCLM